MYSCAAPLVIYTFIISIHTYGHLSHATIMHTGTGKSVYINNTITKTLPQDKFKPLGLGFSAKTSANMTQDIIDGKLDKRRKGVYGPPSG